LIQRQVEEEEEETLQSKPLANRITPLVQVQRQEETEEEEEILQAKPLAEEITPLVQRQVEPEEEKKEFQAKETSGRISEVNSNLESHILSLKGGGQPLSESERTYFEPRFGHDFSQVRMHTDTQAAESARAVNAKAYTVGKDVMFGEGEYAPWASEGKKLLAHELMHVVQQEAVKSTTSHMVQCNGNDKQSNIEKLDEMLNRFDVPEEDVIDLLSKLNPAEKRTVLAGYQKKIARALNIGEMVRAVNNLKPELSVKLDWIKAAATSTSQIDYSDIKGMVISTPKPKRDKLKTDYWRDFFVKVCTNKTMVESLEDLKFDLETKLDWMRAETVSVRLGLDYVDIKDMITSAPQAERDRLKTDSWRDFFVKVCTNKTMVESLKDLKFDLETKLDWMRAETVSIRLGLDYADIKDMITSAPQAERDRLKTDSWRDFFIKVCTNETIVEAVNDHRFDFSTKLDWMFEEGTNWRLVEPILDSIPESEVDTTIKQLNDRGKLGTLLDEVPESEYIQLGKFYYNTKVPSLKDKIAKYYKVPEEQVKGMDLIHEGGRDIEYPRKDIIDPTDSTRKIYDAKAEDQKGYLNKDYWNRVGKWKFNLKSGKSASEGIEKIFEGPTRLECLSIARALLFRTILKTLGEKEFDNRFNSTNMKILPNPPPPGLVPYMKLVTSITSATKESRIQKGDWVYFKNHLKYKYKHPGGAWGGENAFCMGKNTLGENDYRGFGVPKLSDVKMVEKLKLKYDDVRKYTERRNLAKWINNRSPGAFPTNPAGELIASPTDTDLDGWIASHPGIGFDDYHTSKFPNEAPIANIPGLLVGNVIRIKMH